MIHRYNILAIDDDPFILDALEVVAQDIEYCRFYSAVSFKLANEIVNKRKIDLVLVDIVLPEMDGYEICKNLKKHPNAEKAYFILMSGDRNKLLDRIKAFKVGAQEFLAKPFDLKEVELIINSKIEYHKQIFDEKEDKSRIITLGKFLIDDKTKEVKLGKDLIELTGMEYNLLKFFLLNPETFVDLDEIVMSVWGDTYKTGHDNARGLIHRLRSKLEDDPKNPVYITTPMKKSSGYIFYPSGAPTVIEDQVF